MTGRHQAPRSVRRSLGRLATDVTGALPSVKVTGAAAVVGATGLALGAGVVGSSASASRTVSEPDTGTLQADDAPAALPRHRAPVRVDDTDAPVAPHTVVVYDRAADGAQTTVSRSGGLRPELPQAATTAKVDAVSAASVKGNVTDEVAPADPKEIAQSLMGSYGWSSAEFGCLDSLWTKESGWDVHADNPTSSAYGIPQALPGEKMATAGSDWATNPETQIKWGLTYIQGSYGTPCAAWAHSQANNWY